MLVGDVVDLKMRLWRVGVDQVEELDQVEARLVFAGRTGLLLGDERPVELLATHLEPVDDLVALPAQLAILVLATLDRVLIGAVLVVGGAIHADHRRPVVLLDVGAELAEPAHESRRRGVRSASPRTGPGT